MTLVDRAGPVYTKIFPRFTIEQKPKSAFHYDTPRSLKNHLFRKLNEVDTDEAQIQQIFTLVKELSTTKMGLAWNLIFTQNTCRKFLVSLYQITSVQAFKHHQLISFLHKMANLTKDFEASYLWR